MRAKGERVRRTSIIAIAALVVTVLGLLDVAFTQEELKATRDPAAGARLFASKGCVACHAVNGAGGSGAPDLGKMPRPLVLYDFAARMWNHVPQMSGRITAVGANRPYLNADEMSDLMAFLGTVDASGRPGVVGGDSLSVGEPGDRQRGERVVAEKGCLACHALAGQDVTGKAGGSFDRWTGFDSPWIAVSTIWNHAFLMDIEARRQNRPWPRLTAAEMADIAAFLAHR
jgi:mono/diheme cytochrome c family protein